MSGRAAARSLAAAVVALALAGNAAAADGPAARAAVSPPRARLGEPVTYRGQVVLPPGSPRYRWVPPDSGGAFTWGSPRARLGRGRGGGTPDTLQIQVPLQVFETGRVAIPGLELRPEDAAAPALALPVVELEIAPLITPADSAADLRPLRGPMAAPWWERVPWLWVCGGAAVVALAAFLIARRRRRPVPLPEPVPADPVAEARAALEALRRRDLPAQGRFIDHALELSLIARRFLEATRVTPRPGDSTPELLAHLRVAGFTDAELDTLAPLLAHWDRIKFARAGATVDEAHDAERAVGVLIERARVTGAPGAPPEGTAEEKG